MPSGKQTNGRTNRRKMEIHTPFPMKIQLMIIQAKSMKKAHENDKKKMDYLFFFCINAARDIKTPRITPYTAATRIR